VCSRLYYLGLFKWK